MQVVIGGSTPTPSPRVQRKQYQGYGRPLLPGYAQPSSTPPGHHRPANKGRKNPDDNESSLRDYIPAMKRTMAITCLTLNILLPGLGTFVSGLTVSCGSTIRFKQFSKQKVICSNTWVAFLQFVTAFLFLLGWIWSIVWGVAFLTISNDYYKNFKRENMPSKLRAESSVDKSNPNGSKCSTPVNHTGSSPGLFPDSNLQKPLMWRSSSADHPTPSIVVLQKPPVNSMSESSLVAKSIIDPKSRHHHKILKQQMSDNELIPLKLSKDRLEQIVIHNLPRAPVRRGVLRREDTITSTGSNISESECPYS